MWRKALSGFQKGMMAVAVLLAASLVATGPFAEEAGPRYLVQVPLQSEADAARLAAAGLDVAGINRNEMTAGVVAAAGELDRIRALGLEYRVEDVSHPLNGRAEALSDYTDPQEMSAFLDQVQAQYPSIAKKVVLEDTLFEGQQVLAMKITKDVDQAHDRPAFVLDAQHHAREVMTPEIARDMIDYLTSNYGTDSRVTRWVDDIEIWVVTSVNPDGAMYVFTADNMWRKNRHPDCAVDLNRNYTFNWAACDGSGDTCWDETYHGTGPLSEPESQALSALFAQAKPVFNLTYHSYGEYILAPLGCGDPSDMGAIMEVAQALNGILENDLGQTGHYATGPGWDTIYITDGSSDDEAYGRYGILSYCIEVNSMGFQPDYATWRNKTVQRQRTAWQFFLDKTLDAPSVRGRVTDAQTGKPLAASVSVEEVPFVHGELQRTANPKGDYCWVTASNRTVHVTFSLSGYVSQTHEVTVGAAPVGLDVSLEPSNPGLVPHDPVPADGTPNQPLGLTLSWEGSATAGYEVYFGLSSDPPKVATVTETGWTTPALETGKSYYWKVAALTSEGAVTGPVWSFSTYAYGIAGVTKMGNPFRLRVSGTGFKDGCQILIDGAPAPQTVYQGSDRLEARKGSALKAMVPKGVPVEITVRDASGNASPAFSYTR